MKITRKRVLLSLLSLALCFAMLVGTTYAWFTDTVISADNKIQAGNLKLDLERLDKKTGNWKSIKESQEPLFNEQNWEPGYTSVTILKVENEGNLALKWQARFVSSGEISSLAKAIDVYVKPSQTELTYPAKDEITSANGWNMVGTLDKFIDTLSQTTYGTLLANESAYLGIALHMREDAGNEYQNLTLGAFDIRIVATQASHESDGFGTPDYDNDAEYPEFEMSFEQKQSLEGVSTIYNELANELVIRHEATGAYAVLPAGVKLKAGVTELKFSGKSLGKNEGNVGDDEISYDIHIEGIADDNQKCITVYIGKILPAGLGDTEVKLYHEDVQMTRANSVADFARPDQFTYNPATGAVVLYVKNFSVFTAVQENADVWDGEAAANGFASGSGTEEDPFIIETAAQLIYFRNQVDAGVTFDNQFVKLVKDIDLADKPFDPIGFGYWNESKVDAEGNDTNTVFMGTFDGAGHTIYNLYENCWELDPDKTNYSTYTYSTAGAGLFASIKDATIKNLAISGAEIVFECVDMGVVVGYAQGTCHFENIVVTDSNIANYNRYTGGVVGEVSYGPYGIDTSKGYSHTFKNVVVDSTVKVSGLWGSFGCGMGGVIGGKWGDATVKMENVISAAEMDVYNDVVSAYQWYAFRGCGMLIGHTEEPYSDGRHSGNATASFLTCNNVDVYYGDWVNYTYYQFANQTDAQGNTLWYSNYPWVRAEEGEYCDAFSNIRYGIPLINGVKVTELSEEDFNAAVTSTTKITFDQLYGADRGMYGTAAHEGVTVLTKNVKTVYVHNNSGWTNLKLDYWYKHGEDTWTNLLESIVLTPVEGETDIYKLVIPYYADSFKITSAESAEVKTFELSKLADGEHITLAGEHIHSFVNQECVCGSVRFEFGEDAESPGHKESTNAANNYTETIGDYTLSLNAMSKVFTATNDEEGNSCLKLGTGSAIGGFTFTVPDNATSVIIYVAKYKDDASKITVNGIEYELNKNSNDGEYDEIVIDTTETKEITVATTSNAKRCMVNSIVFIVEKADHEHNYESEITEPTCTEDGYTTYTCSICEHSYVEAGEKKKGHEFTETVTVEATCTAKGEKILDCDNCEYSETKDIPVLEHIYVEGVCSLCGDKLSQNPVWQLVTDATNLNAGDKIVIVASGSSVALSTTQNDNNRGQATVTKTENIITFGDDVQILTLESGTKDGTFAFNTGSGYLYAASSSKNYLRTETKMSANSSWSITITSEGVATIKAQGANTRNWLRYNSTNNPPIFSCYGSGQVDVSIYKFIGASSEPDTPACEHTNTTTTTIDATCTVAGSVTVTCDDCTAVVSTDVIKVKDHEYVDGVCTGCGAEEPSDEDHLVEVIVDMSFADIMTGNNLSTTNSTSVDGKTLKLDDNISIVCAKGNAGTAPSYYAPAVRLYQGGATMTVKGTGMKTIVITVNSSSGDGPISVDGGTASALTNMTYTITVNEGVEQVVITTTGTDKNSRVYVSNVKVVYEN